MIVGAESQALPPSYEAEQPLVTTEIDNYAYTDGQKKRYMQNFDRRKKNCDSSLSIHVCLLFV